MPVTPRSVRGAVLAVAGVVVGAAACTAYVMGDPAWVGAASMTAGPVSVGLWLVLLACMLAALLGLGWMYSGHLFGVFISRRNAYSLSQTQFVLWTAIFASAALALFLMRFRLGAGTASLAVEVPTEAAGLMGLAALSFGGTAAVQAAKRGGSAASPDQERAKRALLKAHPDLYIREWLADKKSAHRVAAWRATPDGVRAVKADKVRAAALAAKVGPRTVLPGRAAQPAPPTQQNEVAALARQVREALRFRPLGQLADAGGLEAPHLDSLVAFAWTRMAVEQEGLLHRHRKPSGARVRQLVQGDELTNSEHMDLGKVQLALLSLLAMAAYVFLLWQLFAGGVALDCAAGAVACADQLPEASGGLLGLMAASHVAYLGTKAAGATRRAPS